MTTLSTSKTNCQLHLLTTHTADSSPSLLVTFDQHKYLFNVPESFSRVCVQSKISLKKIGKVFVGDLSENVGGLPGLLLSTVESGNNDVEVVAGEGLEHLVASYRFYTRRERLSLKTTVVPTPDATADRSVLPPPVHADANLIVYALPLASSSALPIPRTPSRASTKRTATSRSPSPRRSKSPPPPFSSDVGPSSRRQNDAFDPSTLVGDAAMDWRRGVVSDMFRAGNVLPRPTFLPGVRIEQSPAYLIASLPHHVSPIKTAISYLAVGPPVRGEFLSKVAIEKGVKAGPKFSALVQGLRVWVTDLVYEAPVRADGRTKLSKAEGRAAAELRGKWEAAIVDGEGPGHWVESAECNGPGQDGRAFLILNLSSPEFLDSLTAHPASLFAMIKDAHLRTVFYFLGPGVLHDPRLATWIATLPSEIEHHFSSTDLSHVNDPIIFAPTSLLSLRLRHLSEKIFSLPHYSFLPPFVKESNPDLALLPPTFPTNSRIIRPNDQVSLMPPSTTAATPKIKTKSKPVTNPRNPILPPGSGIRDFNFLVPSPAATEAASRLKSLEKSEDVVAKAAEAWAGYLVESKAVREQVEKEEAQAAKLMEKGIHFEAGDDIIVTPLGTGSAVPSKYRNVSSTLLHLPDGGYILLDAGEGTWGQIARKFGAEKWTILRELKCIFISHIHQDHHAGLATILRQRNLLDPKPEHPLTVIGPQGARIYLSEQHELSDMGLGAEHAGTSREVFFINNYNVEHGGNMHERGFVYEKMKNLEDLLGLESISTVPVLHRCRCWGIVLVHKSGWKIVFSGDTMPCEALVRAGRGATLLIHEATIESDKPEVALQKGHSTFAQAIDIAKRMEAKTCLLTHFSARYPKLPPLKSHHSPSSATSDAGEEERDPIVAIAFDLMSLRVDEFWKMEKYQKAMEVLFDDGEEKVVKEESGFEEIGE